MGIVTAQTDFSGGQVNGGSKRSEDPQVKTGGLQMLNWRQEAQGTIVPRPGRRALYAVNAARTDTFRMSASVTVQMSFPVGVCTITGLDGSLILSISGLPWTGATVSQISAVQAANQIVICYPGMQPLIANWTQSANTWAFVPYTFSVSAGIIQEPFYRFSVPGATMSWEPETAAYANIGDTMILTCSAPYFAATMIGGRLSVLGGQVTIQSIADAQHAQVLVNSRLPDSIYAKVSDLGPFQIGQIVETVSSGYKFEVRVMDPTAKTVGGPLVNNVLYSPATFTGTDTIESELGTAVIAAADDINNLNSTTFTVQWQEEFMSATAGWPGACFYDQNRLGFCDFPQKPEAILWCAIGLNQTAYIDATAAVTNTSAGTSASSAILEFIAKKVRVRNVVGWGDEFVFTDSGIFQIPVSTATPLKPGGVEFREFSNDGCSGIRPISTLDAIIYINAGLQRVGVVRATGSYTRPYISDDLTALHSDLIRTPICLAVATGDGPEPERYVYVVNDDGSAIVGRFTPQKQIIGWVPILSLASIVWAATNLGQVFFNTTYAKATLLETEDTTFPVDSGVLLNAVPASLMLPGFGPLWWLIGQTITLFDTGLDRGDYGVDAIGNIQIPAGTDTSSPTLQVGTSFSCVFQPVVPASPPGQNRVRTRRRKIVQALVRVSAQCPFNWGGRDIPPYGFSDDTSVAPPVAEGTYSFRPVGRSYDPVVVLTRTRPGFMRVQECVLEVTE